MNTSGDLQMIMEKLRLLLPMLSENYSVETLGIFGSYVRQEAKPSSDIDILVTFRETPGLFKFLALENALSDTLGIKVDLVMKDALKPAIGKRILEEVINV